MVRERGSRGGKECFSYLVGIHSTVEKRAKRTPYIQPRLLICHSLKDGSTSKMASSRRRKAKQYAFVVVAGSLTELLD